MRSYPAADDGVVGPPAVPVAQGLQAVLVVYTEREQVLVRAQRLREVLLRAARVGP